MSSTIGTRDIDDQIVAILKGSEGSLPIREVAARLEERGLRDEEISAAILRLVSHRRLILSQSRALELPRTA